MNLNDEIKEQMRKATWVLSYIKTRESELFQQALDKYDYVETTLNFHVKNSNLDEETANILLKGSYEEFLGWEAENEVKSGI